MENNGLPQWLVWAREIQALAQTSTHYAENDFQLERYRRLTEIAAEMVAAHSRLPVDQLVQVFSGQSGYATPRVDVRAAIFNEQGHILLVRELADGGWTMPGGWADVGDVPSKAAEREAWEEAGFHVCARKLVGVYDSNRTSGPLELFHAYKLIFLCDLEDGVPTPSNETSEVAFFPEDALPGVLSRERTFPRHLQDAFAAHRCPEIATVFD